MQYRDTQVEGAAVYSLRSLLVRFGVNRAVAFGALSAGWQFVAAPITALLIVAFLTPEGQGFYYVFGSLLALQSYLELGLSTVILNASSHQFAHLKFDRAAGLSGDAQAWSKLSGLARFARRWYGIASLIFVVAVGGGGHLWLARSGSELAWVGPWWTLIAVTGAQLFLTPLLAMLEGCNEVANVQRLRLVQWVLRSSGMWLALVAGWQLWGVAVGAAASLAMSAFLVGVEYRRFFVSLSSPPSPARLDWKSEIWPMQWRLAAGSVTSYFLFQLFTPVMFEYHGAVIAGQVGMTLALVSAVQGLGSVWLQPAVPRFGMLVARREFVELNRQWLAMMKIMLPVVTVAAVAAWFGVALVNTLGFPIARRMLGPVPSALFLAGAVSMAGSYGFTVYLRAHVREPLLMLSVMTSLLMGLLVWILGRRFGPMGAAFAYVTVVAGVLVPWEAAIWQQSRLRWHQPEPTATK